MAQLDAIKSGRQDLSSSYLSSHQNLFRQPRAHGGDQRTRKVQGRASLTRIRSTHLLIHFVPFWRVYH